MLRSSLLVLLAALVFAHPAAAQPALTDGEGEPVDRRRVAALSLTYSQPPGGGRCGSEQHFREALTERMGYSPFGSPSPDHPTIVLTLRRIDVAITRTKRAMTATMTGFSDDGKPLFAPRSVTYPREHCEQLIGMAAALAMDAIRSLIPPLPAPPKAASLPAPIQLSPAAPQPKAVAPPDRAPLGAMVGAACGVDIATAPVALASFGYFGALRWPDSDFSLGLEIRYAVGFTGIGEHDMAARFWATTLAPCVHRGLVFGCGLAALGERLFYAGFGPNLPEPHLRNPVFGAVGLRAGVAWQPGNGSLLRLTADLLYAPLKSTLVVDNEEVWSSFPVSATVSIGFQGQGPF